MEASPRFEAVVMGASAGAIEAMLTILPSLPANYPLPLLVVIHIPPDRKSMIAELFQSRCKLRVKEVEDTELIEPGTVYIAPPDYHVLVEPDHRLSLSSEEPVLYSRPSIDVLFESAADVYGTGLLAVILTGANSDGALGSRAVKAAGGTVIIQDPETAYSSAMPKAALSQCPDAQTLDLEQIMVYLQRISDTEPM